MWRACQVSYCIRLRAYRTESTAIAKMMAAAHIPSREATTPARLRNVRITGIESSTA